jgi:hypothetical protein
VAIIAAITIVHYSVSHTHIYIHDISRRLYYLPIILASYWFGKSGGIYSALTITLVYFPMRCSIGTANIRAIWII